MGITDNVHHAGNWFCGSRSDQTRHTAFLPTGILATELVSVVTPHHCKLEQCILSCYDDSAILFHDAAPWRNDGAALSRENGDKSDQTLDSDVIGRTWDRRCPSHHTATSSISTAASKGKENQTMSDLHGGRAVSLSRPSATGFLQNDHSRNTGQS